MGANQELNVNRANLDRFRLILSSIPSSEVLKTDGLTETAGVLSETNDLNTFTLGLASVELPGLTLGELKTETPFVAVSQNDDILQFDPLITEVRIDSNYVLYKLLILWMIMMKSPSSFSQFSTKEMTENLFIGADLLIKNNFDETVMEVEFFDFRPLNISPISLNYTTPDEIIVTVTWGYTYFMPKDSDGSAFNLTI